MRSHVLNQRTLANYRNELRRVPNFALLSPRGKKRPKETAKSSLVVIGQVPKNPPCPKSPLPQLSETLEIRLPRSAIGAPQKELFLGNRDDDVGSELYRGSPATCFLRRRRGP